MPRPGRGRRIILPALALSLLACQPTALQSPVGVGGGGRAALPGPPPDASRRVLAAPDNDLFADAAPIAALPFTDARDTTEATTEPQDTCGTYTVWYTYTPAADTAVSFDLSGSDFAATGGGGYSPTFEVYSGSPGDLTQEACSFGSLAKFTFRANVTYHIALGGGASDSRHDLVVRAYVTPPPPANDEFGAAKAVAIPFTERADLDEATANPGDPACIADRRTTWYVFTAAETRRVAVRTANGPTTLGAAVYAGPPSDLTQVKCEGTPYLSFDAVAGTTYYVATYVNFNDPTTKATLDLNLDYAQIPINDDVSSPVEVVLDANGTFQDVRNTVEATFAPGDEDCMFFGQEAGTVWYRFTASETFAVEANTAGTAFGGTLAVYQRRTDGTLELFQCVSSGFSGPPIIASFDAQAGVTYFFKVLGGSREAPDLTFNVRRLYPPRITLAVDPAAAFDPQTNTIRVTGTISSLNPGTGTISVSALQKVGRLTIGGYGSTELPAAIGPDPVRWAVDVPSDGKWSGGALTIDVYASLQNADGSDQQQLPTRTVRVGGKR